MDRPQEIDTITHVASPGIRPAWTPSRLAVTAVVIGAILIRMFFLVGYQGRDDRNYLAYAQYVASDHHISTLNVENQWVGRVGFWMPIAGAIKVLGPNQLAYVAYPLLISVLGILLTLSLASITVGPRAGLLAAGLLALFPLDVLYATRAYPDLPLGVLMVASYWLALKSRASTRFAWACGLTLGVAYLHKETAVFALMPIALALRFWTTKHWRALTIMGIALSVVVGGELAFWAGVKGNPLHRFTATSSALSTERAVAEKPSGSIVDWIPGPRPSEAYRSENTIADAALMLGTNEELVLLYWLLLPIMLIAAVQKDRQTQDLRLWVAVLLPLIVFLPVVPPYHTMPRDPRYLTCLTIPALLILASYLSRLRARTMWLAVSAFVVTSAVGILLGTESSRMEPQLTLLKRANQGEPLWVSPQFAADLIFLSGVDPNIPHGIHLLQQRRTAGSYEAAVLVRPELPVAETLNDIPGGLLVLREQEQMPDMPGWVAVERISPGASWPVNQVQQLLRTVGLGSFARKLSPGGGIVAVLYRQASPQSSAHFR